MREERGIADELKAIDAELDTLKTAQPIGGSQLNKYSYLTPDAYDWYVRIYQSNPNRHFKITFTPASAKKGALIDLSVASSTSPNVFANQIAFNPPTAPPVLTRWKEIVPEDPATCQWVLSLSKGLTADYFDCYFKVQFTGTDTGSWSIVEI